MSGTYSVVREGVRHIWRVERLWTLSRDLPPFDFAIEEFTGFDVDCWYGDVNVPTVRSVLEHVRRMEAADVDYPIILSASGAVMDGVHRICQAWLRGRTTVLAVRFAEDPEADRTER